MTGDKAAMRGHNETAAQIASEFSNQVGGPVNDATGLTGKYDYTIFWSTADLAAAGPAAAAPADAGPTLFDALQQQLGLKLESRKGPVQVLVVDHVEMKPTDN